MPGYSSSNERFAPATGVHAPPPNTSTSAAMGWPPENASTRPSLRLNAVGYLRLQAERGEFERVRHADGWAKRAIVWG